MIPKDKKHQERMKLSEFVPKPTGSFWLGDYPDPEGMGLHQMQKQKAKRKAKKK